MYIFFYFVLYAWYNRPEMATKSLVIDLRSNECGSYEWAQHWIGKYRMQLAKHSFLCQNSNVQKTKNWNNMYRKKYKIKGNFGGSGWNRNEIEEAHTSHAIHKQFFSTCAPTIHPHLVYLFHSFNSTQSVRVYVVCLCERECMLYVSWIYVTLFCMLDTDISFFAANLSQ